MENIDMPYQLRIHIEAKEAPNQNLGPLPSQENWDNHNLVHCQNSALFLLQNCKISKKWFYTFFPITLVKIDVEKSNLHQINGKNL